MEGIQMMTAATTDPAEGGCCFDEYLSEEDYDVAVQEWIRRHGWLNVDPQDENCREVLRDRFPGVVREHPLALTLTTLQHKVVQRRLQTALQHIHYLETVELQQLMDTRSQLKNALTEAEGRLSRQDAIIHQQHMYIRQLQCSLRDFNNNHHQVPHQIHPHNNNQLLMSHPNHPNRITWQMPPPPPMVMMTKHLQRAHSQG